MPMVLKHLAKKARCEIKFQFQVITELRTVYTVLVYDSICQQSLKKDQQHASVFPLFHGAKQADIMGHAEQFMKGVLKYAGMKIYEGSSVLLWADSTDNELGASRKVIPKMLHWQFGKIFLAGDNLTHDLLSRTYKSKGGLYG
jgi:hypothetical protein